ncbi:MAG: hypothetical protein PHN74_02140 [Candidatus Pacebacteria bacterium]|nr:hypothetical protein [Candidatus Paceibacterota bacterium]
MAKGFILKDNLTKDTLLKIASYGLMTLAASTSPFFLSNLIKTYFKDPNGKLAAKRARKLRELQRRKLIEIKEMDNGSVRVTLSQNGKDLVRQYNLQDMMLKKPKHWDGLWRIMTYDIPGSQRQASMALSRKIRSLGLYQLQKSVWVYPYDIIPEIEFLCAIFNIDIDDNICYFKASDIPREKEARKFFNI